MGEFLKVLKYQEAYQQLLDNFPRPQEEMVSLAASLDHVLAHAIDSPEDLPAFTRTTVDGYAVAAEETFGSSESLPAFFNLAGEVLMGAGSDLSLNAGQCCWIPTGGMLPPGANAAVMVEYTEKLGDDTVLVYRPVGPFENIMRQGEDVHKGQTLFAAGSRLRAQDIGLLASLGVTQVPVFKPYKVGIISTGNEIVSLDQIPGPGQVRDVNSYAIAAGVKSCGALASVYPIVEDDFKVLKKQIAQALEENDVLMLSGGSSVGVMDMTLDVLLSFPQAELLFHGIALKPGKPTMAVKIGSKLVIGLPGHPVSAFMVFKIICAPVLGTREQLKVDARLENNVASQAGRDDFIPVQIICADDNRTAHPLLGKSGLMSTLALADGYIHIAYEQQGLLAGQEVSVHLF